MYRAVVACQHTSALPRVHVDFYLWMDINHCLEWCYMLVHAPCIPSALLAVDSSVSCWTFFTVGAFLPFGRKLKKQLSVMGMSFRIWDVITHFIDI